MKTLTTQILSMAMLLVLPTWVSAQVFNGDLTLSTQAQVDAFHYTEVTGTLTIGYESGTTFSDINSLQPLSKLTKVGSSLIIRHNNQLQDLQGLENLSSVRFIIEILENPSLTSLQGLGNLSLVDIFYIIDNDQLQDLQGLENLTALNGFEGNLSIEGNDRLTSLQGLENLTAVEGDLYIENNASLTSLQGLENLTSIGEHGDGLFIRNNTSLTSLQGIYNLQTLGDLAIRNNPLLNDCCAIATLLSKVNRDFYAVIEGNGSNCNSVEIIQEDCGVAFILRTQAEVDAFNYTEIPGSLTIGNPEEGAPSTDITSLESLSILTKVGDTLSIKNNDQLQDLHGLDNLSSVKNLFVEYNNQLQDLQGLNNLTTIEENIGIAFNTSLTSLQVLKNFTTLNGNLNIAFNTSLTSLQDLENLTTIGRYLIIEGNAGLTSLQGLNNLTSVNDLFNISENDQLQNLQGLENLTKIEGTFVIAENPSLTSLHGLENLSSVNDLFNISENDQLQNLQGLEHLSSVKYISINDNDQLQDLQGLNHLTTIDENLSIARNSSLTSLQGLENLPSISGDLSIEDNQSLASLQGLENLTKVDDIFIGNNNHLLNFQGLTNLTYILSELRIENNNQLRNFQGLENLSSISGGLLVKNNSQLRNFQGLENLSTLSSGLRVINNDRLRNFRGLENLTILRSLSIWNNDQLLNFQGLNKLNVVESGVIIENNPTLTSFHGLENLTSINSLYIFNNDQLQSLEGLENLTFIRENIIIDDNELLITLQGLEKLIIIGDNISSTEYLRITNNPALTSLQGLENLVRINGGLNIINNNQLNTLQSLEKLQSIESLEIMNNPILNDCCTIADLLAKVKGTVNIGSNSSNCNSVEAIQEDCFLITHFTLIDAVTNQDIFDISNDESTAVINISEVGNQLNIRANIGNDRVKSVVFALNGEDIRTENVAPYALAGDDPPGNYYSWTPQLGRHTLTATPYEGKNATGEQGSPLSIELLITDQPFTVTEFTLIATVDHSYQFALKEGSFIQLLDYQNTGLNIRANTTGNVGSVVFDLNKMKNYRTENGPPFALGGDNPPGNYYEVPEIKEIGFFKLTATPYSKPNGKGTAGTPLMITFETFNFNVTENHIVGFALVNADDGFDITDIKNGSTLDLGWLPATAFNIRAITQADEIPGSWVVFDYDGKENFRTERVAPYALGGDINGDYDPFPLVAGQHTLKGTVFPSSYAQSITFDVVDNQEPSARKNNKTSTFSKEVIKEDFSAAIQKVIVYPNPTEGTLSIEFPDKTQLVTLYLYNAQGYQVMETTEGNERVLTLDVSHLAAGMYVLKVATEQRIETHRILLK